MRKEVLTDNRAVAVVVCTFNRAELLKVCLESLASQTLDKDKLEVIVVDNNSTDNTEEVAKAFIEKYPNFRYIMEPKQGLSHARNRGYKETNAEYVAYIDDDAKADKQWTENILNFISRYPDIVAFGGPYNSFSLAKLPAWYKESHGIWSLGDEERPTSDYERLKGTNMIYKRSILLDLRGFNTSIGMSGHILSYGEETNLLMKIKKRNLPIFYVPNIVVQHLIASYKMSLRWMLKSHFMNGFSDLETFELQKRLSLQICKTLSFLLKGLESLIFSKERYCKARIFQSSSDFIWHLGLTVRMFLVCFTLPRYISWRTI